MGNISDKESTYSFGGHYVKGQGHGQGPSWLGQHSSSFWNVYLNVEFKHLEGFN